MNQWIKSNQKSQINQSNQFKRNQFKANQNQIKSSQSNQSNQFKRNQFNSNQIKIKQSNYQINQSSCIITIIIVMHHLSLIIFNNQPAFPCTVPCAFCVNSAGLCSCSMYSKAYLLRSVIHPCIHVGWWSFTTQGPPKTRKPRNVTYLAFFYVASYIHVNIEPWCFDLKGNPDLRIWSCRMRHTCCNLRD